MKFLTVLFLTLILSTSVMARDWGHRRGGGGYERPHYSELPGIVGGVIGGFLWDHLTKPDAPVLDENWCIQRYKSYDPYTRTYLGFDGLRHGCP